MGQIEKTYIFLSWLHKDPTILLHELCTPKENVLDLWPQLGLPPGFNYIGAEPSGEGERTGHA